MNKFEQLIEYVINDEEDKARELFHEIVVEKSRNIYEEIMAQEDVTEAKEEEEEEEEIEESKEEEIEESKEEEVEESMEETTVGGDQADRLIDEIEVEEEGMSMEAEGDDMGDEELEDRVVDLEDKLDELMAEFEALMGGEAGEEEHGDMDMEVDMDATGDEVEMDDTELETESLGEGMDLKAAPKPVTSEEGSVNKKSTVAANSGAKGMEAKPVSETGGEEKGRAAPQAKDLGVTPTQDAGKGAFKSAAPKAQMKEPAGINTKSVN